MKCTVELNEKDIARLQKLALVRKCTMTEALRGAIATEEFIREIYFEGHDLLIRDRSCRTSYRKILLSN